MDRHDRRRTVLLGDRFRRVRSQWSNRTADELLRRVAPGRLAPWAREVVSDESLDERHSGVGDLPPAAIDRKRVTTIRDLDDFGDGSIALLLLERRVGDRPRDGVIRAARDQQQRSALGVRAVNLRLGPW